MEVLRRVNQRSFYLGLGGGAPGARYIRDADDLAVTLREAGTRSWLFKKPYGFAGRGQRRTRAELTADDRRWFDATLRQGGCLAEPWLDIELEVSVHGCIEPDGRFRLGRICVQQVDAYRSWLSSRLAGPEDVDAARVRRLHDRAASAAEALWAAGYWGPFGIDAYLWRTPSGSLELNPMGELNARYTMGFAVGMRCDDFART
jgi:phosphoribosylaminoimidazole carboxylase (NCAIR synthetase)